MHAVSIVFPPFIIRGDYAVISRRILPLDSFRSFLLKLPVILFTLMSTSLSIVCDAQQTCDPDESRSMRFTYSVKIPAPADPIDHLAIWVPLPQTDPGIQSVSDLTIVAPGNYRITTDPEFGNEMIYLDITHLQGEILISWSANIKRRLDAGQGALPVIPRYLKSNRLIPLNDKTRAVAEKVGSRKSNRPVADRAKLIFDDVLDNMEYNKKLPGYGQGDFCRSVSVCKGNCTDFHARFTGIGRASDIPVRFTMGIPLKAGQNRYNSYHCWAHWFDGATWQPVDISEADKIAATRPEKAQWYFGHLDCDRIALTWGRDITLSPPQAGEPLNYFVFPYVEADGKAMKLDKSMWQFSWTDR